MITDSRPLRAIAAALLLAGCSAANLKPQPHPASASNDGACVTASRITSSSEPCSAAGRAYTDKDIQRTGATTAAEALRLLDPSITISR
jgi:outer membrane cobalamin receptor